MQLYIYLFNTEMIQAAEVRSHRRQEALYPTWLTPSLLIAFWGKGAGQW